MAAMTRKNLLAHALALAAMLTCLVWALRKKPKDAVDFQLYVMAMSYQPEFCFQHRHENYEGCHNSLDFWKSHLTIHGMWPEFADGTWPSTCSNEPFNKSTVVDVGSDLERLWPNIKVQKGSEGYYDFWSHEWSKHGTCSGLSQDDYFKATLREFLDTPSIVIENYGKTVSRDELLDAYGGGVVLVCAHGVYLEEVRACLALQDNGNPTSRIPCPDVVTREANCGEKIEIATFPGDGI